MSKVPVKILVRPLSTTPYHSEVGSQGPRNQQLSHDDEAWKISESLFADDNDRISKDMNENEISITRTLPQSISQTPPLFVQRRLLGVLRLPLLDEA